MSDDEREKYPSEEAERFQVRMPPGMRDRLKDAAKDNQRSMNAEIVARLDWTFMPGHYEMLTPEMFDEIFDPAEPTEPARRERSFQPLLNLPDDLREELDFTAKQNGRWINAEIIMRLRRSLNPNHSAAKDSFRAMFSDQKQSIKHISEALNEAVEQLSKDTERLNFLANLLAKRRLEMERDGTDY